MNAEERKALREVMQTKGPENYRYRASAALNAVPTILDEIDRLEAKIEKLVAAGDALARKASAQDLFEPQVEGWDRAKGEEITDAKT
jgi:hypothetical protein